MTSGLPWYELSEEVARTLGLHFPSERIHDLRRGMTAASNEAGIPLQEFARRLLAGQLTEHELATLVSHITVGETYFFRESDLIDALTRHVLPELINRRAQSRRLRCWSAGCCTGEEPYTLAMLLRDTIPDVDRWQISILATDINPRFLHKAHAGLYGDWSFRTAPERIRHKYFHKMQDGRYAIDEGLKAMVTFAPLNLNEAVYPSMATATNAMDLILCRNVLMYFEPTQAQGVVARLYAAMADEGWLSVAPCEASPSLFAAFRPAGFRNTIVYRKIGKAEEEPGPAVHASPAPAPLVRQPLTSPSDTRWPVMAGGAAPAKRASTVTTDAAPHPIAHRAKTLADQGRLEEASALCDRWIAEDALDVAAPYLKALIAMETGDLDTAAVCLRRCAYLAPKEPMINFSVANLDRLQGRHPAALKAYAYVLDLLSSWDPARTVAYSDGLAAAQLTVLASDLIASERLHDCAA